jgi:hypothetical protein
VSYMYNTSIFGVYLMWSPDEPNQVGFRFRTPQGEIETHYTDLSPVIAKKFSESANKYNEEQRLMRLLVNGEQIAAGDFDESELR